MRERLPEWLSHWELWLALLLGGWLRLFALDRTPWLDDQTQLLDMARTAILRGMIPVTGIPSSVGFLNSPISIYLLLPIAAFTSNPLPQTIALALWNVVGVAICYVAALRGFGRSVAFWSALFFAVCPASVWYSRFLWQQNFIAPLLGLWALTLFAAVKTSGRRWFVAHALLLVVCILLHPTVAYLIPVTLIALWLSPHRPRVREYALAAAGVLLLLAPTLLWELQSGWSDVLVLASSAQRSSRYDGEVAVALFNLLGAPFPQTLGAGTLFNRLMPFFNVLTALMVALLVVGWVRLTWRLWRGLRGAWRPAPLRTATWRDRVAWLGAITSDIRSDATWRLSFVLWLWVTIPPVAMIRHSITIFAHYLIVLYPGIFIVIGLGAAWIVSWARNAMRSVQISQQRPVMLARVGLRAAPIALLIALLGGLTLQSTLHTTSVTPPQYSVTEGYGYPLNTMLGAVDALNALQRSEGIANVDIIDIIGATPPPGFYNDLATLLRDERSTRSMMDSACLRLPGTGESLIVAEKATVPAAQLLASLPNATKIGALPLREGVPAAVYRVKPLSGALPGETRRWRRDLRRGRPARAPAGGISTRRAQSRAPALDRPHVHRLGASAADLPCAGRHRRAKRIERAKGRQLRRSALGGGRYACDLGSGSGWRRDAAAPGDGAAPGLSRLPRGRIDLVRGPPSRYRIRQTRRARRTLHTTRPLIAARA